jgi:hypothetical protein
LVGENVYEYPNIYNILHPNEFWFTIQMLGPFKTMADAWHVYYLWNVPNTSRGELLTLGLELMQTYKLSMWSDFEPKKLDHESFQPLTVKIVKNVLNRI